MPNIYLKGTIEKNWRSQICHQVSFWGAPTHQMNPNKNYFLFDRIDLSGPWHFVIFNPWTVPSNRTAFYLNCFCYFIWFDESWNWRLCKWSLFVKCYCFFETTPWRFENYKLQYFKQYFWVNRLNVSYLEYFLLSCSRIYFFLPRNNDIIMTSTPKHNDVIMTFKQDICSLFYFFY